MNRSVKQFGLAAGLVLLLACQSWGQGQPPPQPAPAPSQPAAGAGGGNRGSVNQPNDQTQQNRDQQLPLYVEGQIINENGQAPADPISVKLNCGMRNLQTIKTDIRGYFRFALGVGTQANADFSAADETPSSSILTGMNVPGGYSGFGTSSNGLTGCDIRISVPGFVPMDVPITDPASLGVIDIGVLELRRIGTAPAGSVSATSLLVPNNARKEFDQGVKDLRSNRLPQATQHLERAVGAYDKYAAAWMELGKAYAANHEMAKARQSFEKAIASDSKYAPPYVSLGAVQLEDQDYEGALENIAKATEIDPTIIVGVAGYVQGVANWRLNRLAAAQESLLQAEKAPHANTPQLHVILADIFLRRQDSAGAATHMRAYIKEAPQGSFAVDMRRRLAEIDQAAANEGGAGGRPAIAP
jgi:tetratricopeptide (TPR) repeat protein